MRPAYRQSVITRSMILSLLFHSFHISNISHCDKFTTDENDELHSAWRLGQSSIAQQNLSFQINHEKSDDYLQQICSFFSLTIVSVSVGVVLEPAVAPDSINQSWPQKFKSPV